MGSNPRLEAALAYAGRAWHVFPLAPGSKEPCYHRDDLEHGKNDATRNRELILTWWRRWPDAGIGIAMAPSGLVGYDVDPRAGGHRTHAELVAAHGESLPLTACVETGRRDGGGHLYFARPAGLPARTVSLGPGVSLIGLGYLVAPPSRHPSTGLPYRWTTSPGTAVAALPPWLAEKLRPRARPPMVSRTARRAGDTLGDLFLAAGLVRRVLRDDRLAVTCPWASLHSSDPDSISSTVVFAPGPDTPHGWFHCSHDHCRGRLQLEVWAFFRAHCAFHSRSSNAQARA